ncbi:hypothetical protein HUU40_00070 [candidate division KSB1 bacterium]|nr:hypothetical protein [candidate division KSB1 bacterium]
MDVMTNVYKWPPVVALAKKWTVLDPVSSSESLFTGAEYVSTVQRRRRIATVQASAIFSPYAAGGGYMEALKRYLKGGIHLVRLRYKTRTKFGPDVVNDELRGGEYIGWIEPPAGVEWTEPPGGVVWFNGTNLTCTIVTDDAGFPNIRIEGLPPNKLVALPGEFVEIVSVSDVVESHVVAKPTYSNGSGVARVRVVDVPSFGGRVSLGSYDTGVFKADELPEAMEPGGADWSYTWNFTEVYEDERGPFVELNPWI